MSCKGRRHFYLFMSIPLKFIREKSAILFLYSELLNRACPVTIFKKLRSFRSLEVETLDLTRIECKWSAVAAPPLPKEGVKKNLQYLRKYFADKHSVLFCARLRGRRF